MRREIEKWLANNEDRVVALAQELVRRESENHPPHGNERAVQEFVSSFWEAIGVDCDVFTPDDVPDLIHHAAYRELDRRYSDRPIVVAKLAGSGGGRSLLLSGHVDVVPAAGDWTYGPYDARIENGRLYGRGAYDMKGGVAAMMAAASLIKESGIGLKGDVILETVPDEEFAGGNGTVAARARGYSADAALIAEPTELNLVTANRGFRLAQVVIPGQTGIPVVGGEMVNPIQHLTPLLAAIEEFRASRLPVTGEDTVMITKLAANEFRQDELLTVPPECRIEVYWQVTPEEEIAEVDQLFEQTVRSASSKDAYFADRAIEISYHLRPTPGSRVAVDAPIVVETQRAVESAVGTKPSVLTTFVPCDLFVFNRFCDIPAVVFGPRGGNAHAPDEYVLVEDLKLCTAVYAELIVRWCGVED